MPRLVDGIVATDADVWASGPGAILPGLPSDITRATGWTSEYADDAADETPRLETFQQLFHELYTFAKDVNVHGILEWNSTIAYEHPALVSGTDGRVYSSVQSSTNVDPTTDATDSHWLEIGRGLIPDPDGTVGSVALTLSAGTLNLSVNRTVGAQLTTSVALGIPEKASLAEIREAANDTKFVTPNGLLSKRATESRIGLVRKATTTEVAGLTNDEAFVTVADVVTILRALTGSIAASDLTISTTGPGSGVGDNRDFWAEV